MIRTEQEVNNKLAEIINHMKNTSIWIDDEDYAYIKGVRATIDWMLYDGPDPMDIFKESE